jgi:hypothetical protein
MRKVLPFIKPDYFEGVYRILFKEAGKFVGKYNKLPTVESFKIEVDQSDNFSKEHYKHAIEILPNLFSKEKIDEKWLLDSTEKWCQDRAVYNAIMESIQIIDGKHSTLTKGALPNILQKALGVCFDANVGHDYIENINERFDFYHADEEKIPFDLEYFNKITKGGIPNKTLNICLAGTGVGKSLFMCHVAGSALVQGYNVLYVTLEMAEERIAERIDANLLNIPIDQIPNLSKDMFSTKVQDLARKTQGKLIIKEYPTGQANTSHMRSLINELKLKKDFDPDIPIFSATQTTRSGYTNSDIGLEDTSESFGLPATADLMFAIISTEELENMGQLLVKQLKNRYNDPVKNKRFVVGVDRSKMRLFDIEESEQDNLVDDTPVFDKTKAGEKFKDFKL